MDSEAASLRTRVVELHQGRTGYDGQSWRQRWRISDERTSAEISARSVGCVSRDGRVAPSGTFHSRNSTHGVLRYLLSRSLGIRPTILVDLVEEAQEWLNGKLLQIQGEGFLHERQSLRLLGQGSAN